MTHDTLASLMAEKTSISNKSPKKQGKRRRMTIKVITDWNNNWRGLWKFDFCRFWQKIICLILFKNQTRDDKFLSLASWKIAEVVNTWLYFQNNISFFSCCIFEYELVGRGAHDNTLLIYFFLTIQSNHSTIGEVTFRVKTFNFFLINNL